MNVLIDFSVQQQEKKFFLNFFPRSGLFYMRSPTRLLMKNYKKIKIKNDEQKHYFDVVM